MEQLLEAAGAAFDAAEVWSCEQRVDSVSFADGRIHGIDSRRQTGLAVRVVRGGRVGFAYSRDPGRRRLVRRVCGEHGSGADPREHARPHSGNIPNGDYSVGVCPALYVEGGEIVGRVRDAMVAGNAWQTLQDVVAVGDTVQPTWGGRAPPILCDGVSVAVRGG